MANENSIWDEIEKMTEFAEQKIKENPEIQDEWYSFDNRTDIHIEAVDDFPITGKQAIAYPVDEKGRTIVDSAYIQLF